MNAAAARHSAGIALWRRDPVASGAQLLLGHMGGPFFANKHEAGWSFPKGLTEPGEDLLQAALREFGEEMGTAPPQGPTVELGSVRGSGKTITIFARRGDFDASAAVSNTFELQWPPRSGIVRTFPEIDRAEWVNLADAATLLTKGQRPFVARVEAVIARDESS